MSHSFYIALKYLKFHWVKTLLLILAISMVIFIPLGMNLLVENASEKLISRAEETPLLMGAKGSATELSLSSLYFKKPKIAPIPYKELKKINTEGLSEAFPLHLEYQVQNQPIVGTSTGYLKFRKLELAEGRNFAILGECVLGSKAAKILNAQPGDAIFSSPAGAFDVAGSFPLKMQVVGVLKETGTPDDEAVFTDIKTSWVISGKAHGHQDLKDIQADSLLLSKSENEAIASSAVLSYTEITPENISSFHFHGEEEDYPVNAIIVNPKDLKSSLMLRGRYENEQSELQMLVPEKVIGDLVATVISIRNLLIIAAIIIGIACLAIVAFVFALSIRLRKAELKTMNHIGASGNMTFQILGIEIGIVLISAIIQALLLTLLIGEFATPLIEKLIN